MERHNRGTLYLRPNFGREAFYVDAFLQIETSSQMSMTKIARSKTKREINVTTNK
jgi:hypothetical protein